MELSGSACGGVPSLWRECRVIWRNMQSSSGGQVCASAPMPAGEHPERVQKNSLRWACSLDAKRSQYWTPFTGQSRLVDWNKYFCQCYTVNEDKKCPKKRDGIKLPSGMWQWLWGLLPLGSRISLVCLSEQTQSLSCVIIWSRSTEYKGKEIQYKLKVSFIVVFVLMTHCEEMFVSLTKTWG